MLGFLIAVSIGIFIIGTYLIVKRAKEKKEKKLKEKEEVEDLPFTSFDDKKER